ncbi:MAG: CoA pyrophosphatase [Anaerolineae bacterium]|nr:CoA pyrophosphatase [Anaerolineae bacterium]
MEKLRDAWEQNQNSEIFNDTDRDFNEEPKCAAVLIPLVRFGDEWHLIFTRRADNVDTHKGQVSFPGGACEPEDKTPEETALREADEEIGIKPKDVRLLGRITPMITVTNYRVTPVVAVLKWPYAFRVQYAEVARVFTIPLSWLFKKENRWEFYLPGRDQGLIVYHNFDGELLWGATALMTDYFIKALGV